MQIARQIRLLLPERSGNARQAMISRRYDAQYRKVASYVLDFALQQKTRLVKQKGIRVQYPFADQRVDFPAFLKLPDIPRNAAGHAIQSKKLFIVFWG